MPSFRLKLGARSSTVEVSNGGLDGLGEAALGAGLRPGRAAVITDANVARLYLDRTRKSLERSGFKIEAIEIPPGERSKSLPQLEKLYDRLIGAELTRQSPIFALGGGVVGDLAGFAAATYLRGVPLVQVPTTVVGQVDSALGGKTGVNHTRGKNLIGAFYQPCLTMADPALLESLPDRELREGLAEVIKYGAIMDGELFALMERDISAVLKRDRALLEQIIYRSLQLKASVVEADEHEGGARKTLNFGHTVGHALEAASEYGRFLHGEAVAIGMIVAAELSMRHAGLTSADARRLKELTSATGLPTSFPKDLRTKQFSSALGLDKKRTEDQIDFVLIPRIGQTVIRRLGFDEIMDAVT